MGAFPIHEGGKAFMDRALHFARREAGEQPRVVPMPVTWLAYLLLLRAGVSVDAIAAIVDVRREHISRRLLMAMALLKQPHVRARVEVLVAEMGRVDFEDRGGQVVPFPGPQRLSRHITEVAL